MRSITRLSTQSECRWRVALLGARGDATSRVKTAILESGGEVAVEAPPRIDSLALVDDAAPDVVVLRPHEAAGCELDLLPFTAAGHPVVLFTSDSDRPTLELAARAGVMAVLLEPSQPGQVAASLDLAIARFRDWDVLRGKLADRKVIERAKGRLMALGPMTEEEAFRCLRDRSMNSRSPMADVARALLESDGAARQLVASQPGRRDAGRGPIDARAHRSIDRPGAPHRGRPVKSGVARRSPVPGR